LTAPVDQINMSLMTLSTRYAALLGAAFLFGCSAAGDKEPQPLRLQANEDRPGVVEAAAARWTTATGVPVEVAGGGVPVVFLQQVFDLDRELCGGLVHKMSGRLVRIEIATEPSGYCSGGSLMHELGHALLMHRGHTAHEHVEAAGHLLSAPSNPTTWIDEMSLEFVCTRIACGLFNPETGE
jgi:hypothetical protein